jgi:predicted DNA binding CopG/RHH family protein
MAKRQSASSVRGRRPGKSARPTTDADIDFSDIPELNDGQLRNARRVGRPSTGKAKQLIALRIAPELLAQLKRLAEIQGKPYQTLMHQILEQAVRRRAA